MGRRAGWGGGIEVGRRDKSWEEGRMGRRDRSGEEGRMGRRDRSGEER